MDGPTASVTVAETAVDTPSDSVVAADGTVDVEDEVAGGGIDRDFDSACFSALVVRRTVKYRPSDCCTC